MVEMYNDRIALVTGCGKVSGLGAAIAIELATRGVTVIVTDVVEGGASTTSERQSDNDQDGLAHLCERIKLAGGQADWMLGDVSREDDVDRLIADTMTRYGRLDILVNNAAAPMGDDRRNIVDVSLDAWQRVININITGTFLMARAAVRVMRETRSGRIINISSAAMHHPMDAVTAYATSKAAISGFTMSLSADVARFGITVNAVAPGVIATGRVRDAARQIGGGDVAKGMVNRSAGIMMGRLGEPAEIAAAVAFLASSEASYITGQTLLIDGGGVGIPHVTERSMPGS